MFSRIVRNSDCSCHIDSPCPACVEAKWECGECWELHDTEEEAEDCCEPKEPRED